MEWLQRLCDFIFNLRQYPEPKTTRPLIVAHRGAFNEQTLENTQGAFLSARSFKMWGIEFDVRFTKDNFPIIHHDANLQRIFKLQESIVEHSWAELTAKTKDLCSLKDVVSLTGLHLMIELKTQLSPEQQEIFVQHLAHLKPNVDFHILVLDPALIFEHPKLPTTVWILVGEFNLKQYIELCLEKNYGGVCGHYLLMTRKLIRQLQSHNKKVGVGFVPNKNIYNLEWSLGVDWVFTNHAEKLS